MVNIPLDNDAPTGPPVVIFKLEKTPDIFGVVKGILTVVCKTTFEFNDKILLDIGPDN